MATRTQITGGGGATSHTPATSYRSRKGYAARRVAYDRRRRRTAKTRDERAWEGILRRDPCALCPPGRRLHEQIAVDHIDPLDGGGLDHWENQAGLCRACNAAKKDKKLILFMAERRL